MFDHFVGLVLKGLTKNYRLTTTFDNHGNKCIWETHAKTTFDIDICKNVCGVNLESVFKKKFEKNAEKK